MFSKGDYQVKKAGKIKGAKNVAAIYGWGSMTGNNNLSVSCAPIVTELIYNNFLSVCQPSW